MYSPPICFFDTCIISEPVVVSRYSVKRPGSFVLPATVAASDFFFDEESAESPGVFEVGADATRADAPEAAGAWPACVAFAHARVRPDVETTSSRKIVGRDIGRRSRGDCLPPGAGSATIEGRSIIQRIGEGRQSDHSAVSTWAALTIRIAALAGGPSGHLSS